VVSGRNIFDHRDLIFKISLSGGHTEFIKGSNMKA